MKQISLLVILMMLASFHRASFAAATAPSATQGTVNGVVTDADGKIVANIKVRIKKVVVHDPIGKDADPKKPVPSLTVATLTTDKDGKFTTNLEAGSYFAEAGNKMLGYDREEFDVKATESVEVKVKLAKN